MWNFARQIKVTNQSYSTGTGTVVYRHEVNTVSYSVISIIKERVGIVQKLLNVHHVLHTGLLFLFLFPVRYRFETFAS